jgi:Zn-dependent peptidase ImmA (M78 family)
MTKRVMRYPPLPKAIEGPGGPVRVIVSKQPIRHEHAECWGLYDSELRTITIDGRAAPRQRWKTFFHELVHVAILDSGLDNGLSDALHEAICDAIATARMRERFG